MPTETSRPHRFTELFGGLPGDGKIASLARAAARAGYAVMPIKPGSKYPLCTLTARQAVAADKAAAIAARETGRRNWERVRHDCGKSHATTDPNVAHRVFTRLADKHPDLNLAVEVAASRCLVVDADTANELASFTTLWARQENEPALKNAAPTVRSPGVQSDDGQWRHSQGGHYWFLLPDDVELGDLTGTTCIPIGDDPDSPAQLKVTGYVLVPPSVRPEGVYRMASDAYIAPSWLIDHVTTAVDGRRITRNHRADRCLDESDTVSLAQSTIAWSEVLAPRGWDLHYKVDRCGCEIWTAPGEHASPKSATAHDPGCGQFDTPDGFLHLWTDNPPPGISESGSRTLSKIQVVAWSDHGGDMGTAMETLAIPRSVSQPTVLPKDDAKHLASVLDDDDPDDEDDEPAEEVSPVDALLAELISADGLDAIPALDPLIEGVLDRNSIARVIGTSGHGKSFLMLDISAHVALGRPWHGRDVAAGQVVYMVAEGVAGIRARVRAWEAHHDAALGGHVKFMPRAIQVMDQTEWMTWVAAMARIKPTLIVVDTQARVTAGINENDAKEMGVLVARCELLRQHTGACVVLVHHKGRNGDHGRGSTVVTGALDAEISVTKQGPGRVTVVSEKQKDREDFDPISLDLVKVGESAVLVAHSSVDAGSDPFKRASEITETSPVRDRVAALVHRVFAAGNGGTKAEVWAVVKERDRGTTGRPMSKATFYRAWAQLEESDALIVNETDAGKRWQLDLAEAVRLGLHRSVNDLPES